MRWIAALAAGGLAVGFSHACSFCAGTPADRNTLREHFAESAVVAWGNLADATIQPDGSGGRTTFTPRRVLKSALPAGVPVTVAQYLPTRPETGTAYLLFAAKPDAPVEPLAGTPAGPAVVAYVHAAGKLPPGVVARLGFAFAHLAAADPVVRNDAYLEFAKASDADITAAAGVLKPDALRALLADPATPADRHGVFAYLLGLCARPADADWLYAQVTGPAPPAAVMANLGGYLAALALADPARGWQRIQAVVTAPARPYADRLAAVGAARTLFDAKAVHRAHAVACQRAVLACPDLADVAAEDLRRWGALDALPAVLAVADRPTHAGRLNRRAFVRFALACPGPAAAAYVARVRAADPKLVAAVEAVADPEPASPPR